MKLAAWALGVAGLLLTAPAARAEFFEFTSTITIDQTGNTPNVPGSGSGATSTFTTPGGNVVTLNALDSIQLPPRQNGQGAGTDIVPLNISVGATAPMETIDFGFTLTVTFVDYPSLFAANPTPGTSPLTFTFTGRIGGSIGDFQTNLDLLSFAPPASLGQTGNIEYLVNLKVPNGFAPPGVDQDGRLTLHVRTRAVPEPGSLALLGMGGAGALGMFLRRRVRASA